MEKISILYKLIIKYCKKLHTLKKKIFKMTFCELQLLLTLKEMV